MIDVPVSPPQHRSFRFEPIEPDILQRQEILAH
jgi:hypothetical protein